MSPTRTCGCLVAIAAAAGLAACSSSPSRPEAPPSPGAPTGAPGTSVPEMPPPPATEVPPVVEPPPPPPKSFKLGPATSALVTQARGSSGAGDYDAAAATLERALRIEPANPLVWIEMARVRLESGDAQQAENMARRALSLAVGAPKEQAEAWRLINEAQRKGAGSGG